jgi:hypothetical protein
LPDLNHWTYIPGSFAGENPGDASCQSGRATSTQRRGKGIASVKNTCKTCHPFHRSDKLSRRKIKSTLNRWTVTPTSTFQCYHQLQ